MHLWVTPAFITTADEVQRSTLTSCSLIIKQGHEIYACCDVLAGFFLLLLVATVNKKNMCFVLDA